MVSSAGLGGKKVLVMGLGLHGGGVSVVRWILKHGARVTITDLKTRKNLGPSLRKLDTLCRQSGVSCILGRHDVKDFRRADIVIQNPAVPAESPFLRIARKAGATIENEATLFFRYCKSKNIIGVTGTRGKSTTAAMIAHIIGANLKSQISNLKSRVWLAGNIRTTPMLSIVDRVRPNDWVVLELSSWHLENIGEHKMSPYIAVVTNVLDDHMNRYKTKASYAAAKENIVRYQRRDDIAVLNKVNLWTRAMAKKTKARVVWFPNNELRIPNYASRGDHFLSNAQAAATVTQAVGIPKKIINAALKTFQGLPDRQEVLRKKHGVTYVNDTTATTPDATIAALQRFGRGRNIVLIAGGTDKNLNFQPLIPWIKKTCTAVVLLPGSATEKIKKLLVTRYALRVTEASSMRQAVKTAQTLATHGDVVLLSPAAASFACPPNVRVPQSRSPKGGGIRLVERRGLFQHEFDRGDQFRRAVKAL